jgi:hypothetical protein
MQILLKCIFVFEMLYWLRFNELWSEDYKKYLWDNSILFSVTTLTNRSRGSSVSIVSDYRVDDWAIGVRSPAGAKDFSSNLCVQTGSEAKPASCTMDTGILSPGQSTAKAWRWPLTHI